MTCQIDCRGVQNAGKDENHIAGHADVNQRGKAMYAGKGAEGKEYCVHQLGQQGGAVIAKPKTFLAVPENFLSAFPNQMISADVEHLHDAVYCNAHQHKSRCIGKYRLNGRHRPVIEIGRAHV